MRFQPPEQGPFLKDDRPRDEREKQQNKKDNSRDPTGLQY
jgi:hypothetical protein